MFASKRVLLRTIERMQHDHAAQVASLVATIARLSGHPEPTPIVRSPEVEQRDRERRERRARLVSHPERLPD